MGPREKIIGLLDNMNFSNDCLFPDDKEVVADSIIALLSSDLSGIEAVKECEVCEGKGGLSHDYGYVPCVTCTGGYIIRELTKDEAISAAKNIINSMSFSNEYGEILRVKEAE